MLHSISAKQSLDKTPSRVSYNRYLLSLLTIVGTLNFLDRHILALSLEFIKKDLGLQDSQLGLLTGFGFAFFYAIAGIPLARWADRGNRNKIVSITVALWSGMVVLSGMTSNFMQLLAVRVGVAVGQAGCIPTSQSLIADYYPRESRPRAMGLYWLCGPLAIVLGFLLGGWLIELIGWRKTFIAIGVPGFFVAILVKLTLREPRLDQHLGAIQPAANPPFRDVFSVLWNTKGLRYITISFCLINFSFVGIDQWMPTFFIRKYGLDISSLGFWFAMILGVGGLLGTYLGGDLMARYMMHQEKRQMRSLAVGVLMPIGFLYIATFLMSNLYMAFGCMAVIAIAGGFYIAPVFSAIQSMVGDDMRAVTIAMIFLLANLTGFSIGPIVVGLISDSLSGIYGKDSLQYALALFSPSCFLVSYYLWKVSTTIEDDIL